MRETVRLTGQMVLLGMNTFPIVCEVWANLGKVCVWSGGEGAEP